jgi:hypothetical protein
MCKIAIIYESGAEGMWGLTWMMNLHSALYLATVGDGTKAEN